LGDGSHPDDGIYVMLKEVIDNSVDEFIMGNGKKIEVKLNGKNIDGFGARLGSRDSPRQGDRVCESDQHGR
jgi:hypothetical protein